MLEAGLDLPRSTFAYSVDEALAAAEELGFPVVIRPSYVLGGGGSGVVSSPDELVPVVSEGIRLSSIGEVLVEESISGWKEFELELMRDRNDNVVVVCSIENLDPMGVHTGDSITVAPAMTLTDVEYQGMRDDGARVMRAIGVETGGSNVQFAVDPETGRRVIIEMNPRVSRSSALASKATGFPIAKIAAKLAVGYTLDEITNDITKKTPASFEPSIDYVVVKIPRFNFEKFAGTSRILGTKMKSVGEVMAIGRTFSEALQKGFRSLERDADGLGGPAFDVPLEECLERIALPTEERLHLVERALYLGADAATVARASSDRPLVRDSDGRIVDMRRRLEAVGFLGELDAQVLKSAKRLGFCDAQIAGALESIRGRGAGPARRVGRAPDVQDRRHLRGRVRGVHAVLLLDLRGRRRGHTHRARQGSHPRVRAEPHRPGDRVRLLLRARRVRSERRRLRDDHAQLQPRDRVDRLRHVGPALLRAADVRGRHERRREGTPERRHRATRRPDSSEAGGSLWRASGVPDPRDISRRRSTGPRTASGSATCLRTSDFRIRQRDGALRSRGDARSRTRSGIRCSSGPRTCSGAARWRSSTRPSRSSAT